MIRKNNIMLYTFNKSNCTAWGGCHWERSGPRHPLGGAPSVRSESSVRSRTAAGRCSRPERQPKTLYEETGQFFHIRPNMDNNDPYLHLSKCFVVLRLFLFPEVELLSFHVSVFECPRAVCYLKYGFFRRTLYDMLINCTCLSYRRSRVMSCVLTWNQCQC